MEQQFDEMGANTSIIDPGFRCQLQNEIVGSLAEAFGRYETMHERRLYAAIKELERLQSSRRTVASVTPSVATPSPNS